MTKPIRLARGCYLTAAQPSFAARCAALLRVNPAETVAVGTTAAALHGIWLPDHPTIPEFATCVPGRASAQMTRSRRPEIRTHRRQLSPSDRVVLAGVPATGLARTWWDLATVLSLPDLVAAGDRVLQLGCSIEELAELLSSMRRRRGAARAKQALPLLDARSRSRPESHLRVAVRLVGLDCFEVNMPITDEYGQWLAEPDLSCRLAKLALEYQGAAHADPARMRRDLTRLTDLRRNGWQVLLYGPAEVLSRPWEIGPEVRAIIAERAPQLLGRLRPAS